MEIIRISSGAPWEGKIGYSRVVRAGNIIEFNGSVAVKDGNVVGLNDPYAQAVFIINLMEEYLNKVESSLEYVIKCRVYLTDKNQWDDVSRAFSEKFLDIKPCLTMLVVKELVSPEYLIEIEATAVGT
jgi:enamine deaminase RidA (YjgF/YER057c/UK114 family)